VHRDIRKRRSTDRQKDRQTETRNQAYTQHIKATPVGIMCIYRHNTIFVHILYTDYIISCEILKTINIEEFEAMHLMEYLSDFAGSARSGLI